ncbi:hypothetical protein CCYA_CCYA04G1436 [Cyanidiococcus yangmingshanensis]|nr:hypothetical protein CCYA_CCYA04G1436 [Cyanidiococcus yangmingshanensis]
MLRSSTQTGSTPKPLTRRAHKEHDSKGATENLIRNSSRRSSLSGREALHWKRRLFHFLNGYLLVLVFRWYFSRKAFSRILSVVWLLQLIAEIWRLQDPRFNSLVASLLGPVMRSHELHKFSGMLPYILGALLTVSMFPETIAIIAVALLATTDPVAALIGNSSRRFPHIDRWARARHNKSLIGSFAGFVAAMFTMYAVLRASTPTLRRSSCFWANCILPSAVAAAVEWLTPSPQPTLPASWFPFALDDNLLIPPLVAWTLQHTMVCLNASSLQTSPWIFV